MPVPPRASSSSNRSSRRRGWPPPARLAVVKKMTARRHRHNSPKRTIKRRAGLVSRLLDSHPHEMNRAFKYDVAISATDFDALAATELKRRLEHVLAKGVNAGAPAGTAAAVVTASHK